MRDFKGKVAVITGGANGIGLGIAKRAAREGMKVVLADIDREALAKAEKEIKGSHGAVLSVVTDVSNAEDVEALARKTLDTFGEVRLLCNNAGVIVAGLLWEQTLKDWKYIMGVNLWGVINGIRVFVPIMLKQANDCHIVNTSSVAGISARGILMGSYSMTKSGIVSLSETLARELANEKSRVKVSVLCPGFVSTNLDLNSIKNRPEQLRNPGFEPDKNRALEKWTASHPQYKSYLENFGKMIEMGPPADKAGDIVFEAIKDDAFYIFTDTGTVFRNMLRDRTDGILGAFEKNKAYARGTSAKKSANT